MSQPEAAPMPSSSSYRRTLRLIRDRFSSQAQQWRDQLPHKSEHAKAIRAGAFDGAIDENLELIKKAEPVSKRDVVLFPTYAKRNSRNDNVLVNVHGWVHSYDTAGRQTKRNRYTMMLARSVAGLPSLIQIPQSESLASARLLKAQISDREQSDTSDPSTMRGSQPRLALRRALTDLPSSAASNGEHASSIRVERDRLSDHTFLGSAKHVLQRKEVPSAIQPSGQLSGSSKSDEMPKSPKFERHYGDHDLATCHANLTTRIAPFLSRPVSGRNMRARVFDSDMELATEVLTTNDVGHFRTQLKVSGCAASAKSLQVVVGFADSDQDVARIDVEVIDQDGISIISDMDDTVKHTGVVDGMREAFRNAFVKDLWRLEISGVRQWYARMAQTGSVLHYVSNAPYQLWPTLASFIRTTKLPTGSVHLKAYSGVLQGIWEPAADKKRASVESILVDFPHRKFLLIGDSGEQDLELYTEFALLRPHQIAGIFIRNVSTERDYTSTGVTPTGISGEDFFTSGAGDHFIDPVLPLEMQPHECLEGSNDYLARKPRPGVARSLNGLDLVDVKNVRAVEKHSDQAHRKTPQRPLLGRSWSAASFELSLSKSNLLGLPAASRALDAQQRKQENWARRIQRARSHLPAHVKIFVWRDGTDVQEHAMELIRHYSNH
ncbi:hypothetical protein PYCC9005_006047 [Savitreella phatthalungensis]